MQTTFRAPFASRTPVAGRRSARCQATKPEVRTKIRWLHQFAQLPVWLRYSHAACVTITYHLCVQMATLARRELLASGAAFAASLIAVASAQAAGESSATRAITAVTRPQQLAKKCV